MKKFLPLISISLLILTILALTVIYGCGTTTSGGGGGEPTTDGSGSLAGNNIITIKNAGTGGLSVLSGIPAITITGKVRKSYSDTGIQGVLILAPGALGGTVTTETDSSGNYSLSGVKTGSVAVSAAKSGYVALTTVCDATKVYFNMFEGPANPCPSADCTIEVISYVWNGTTWETLGIILGTDITYFWEPLDSNEQKIGMGWTSGDISVASGRTVHFACARPLIGATPAYTVGPLSPGGLTTVEAFYSKDFGTLEGTYSNIPADFLSPHLSSTLTKLYHYGAGIPTQTLEFGQGEFEGGSSYKIVSPPSGSEKYNFLFSISTQEGGESKYSSFSKEIQLSAGEIKSRSLNSWVAPTTIQAPDTSTSTPTFEWSSTVTQPDNAITYVMLGDQTDNNFVWMCITKGATMEYPSFPAASGATLISGHDYKLWIAQIQADEVIDISNLDFANPPGSEYLNSQNSISFTMP